MTIYSAQFKRKQEVPLNEHSRNSMVTQFRQNGLLFLMLENAYIRIIILPAIGGKIVELTKKQSGTQFFLQPSREYSNTRLPYYGADHLRYDPSGFDDCFPTIAASTISTKDKNRQQMDIHFPDHGELWGIPWEYHVSEESVYLNVHGVRVNYEFSKSIRLDQTTVHINYRLINLSDSPFMYIWSAQPLLEAHPGSEIILDASIDKVFLDWTTDSSIGQHGEYLPWPWLDRNQNSSLAISPPCGKQHTMKLYTDVLESGFCGYVRSDSGEKLFMEFDPRKIPYIGILLWYNAWPDDPGKTLYTVSLQPSSGRPDTLQQAYCNNECSQINTFSMEEWSLKMRVT